MLDHLKKNKFLVFLVLLALTNVILAQGKLRAGRAGCNPTCGNGGSCTKGVNGFRCRCIVGFYGVACGKTVNYCKTLSDGLTAIRNPCSSDPNVTSCAPTVTMATAGTAPVLTALAGYACFQNDRIGTCAVVVTNNVFTYTCTVNDDVNYVYGY